MRRVLRRFGRAYRGHRALAAGTINTNLRVETDQGPLFLRVNEGRGAAAIEAEARLLRRLADRGVPTPVPISTPQGAACVIHRGKPWSLGPWVEGRHVCTRGVTPGHAAAVGAALGALHLAGGSGRALGAGRYTPARIASRLRETAPRVAGDPELAAQVARLQAELAALRRAYRAAGLPSGAIHQDLFRDNVLFAAASGGGAGTAVAALLDFEQAVRGPFVYDLAVTLCAFCFGAADFVPEHVEALVAGYAGRRRLERAERAALPLAARFAAVRFATTRITDVYLVNRARPGTVPGKDYRRFLARLDRLDAAPPPLGARRRRG